MTLHVVHVTFDCVDASALATFWAKALRAEVLGSPSPEFAVVGGDRLPQGHPMLMFLRVPEGKSIKNRVHLDLETPGSPEVEIERLLSLGASLVDQKDEWDFKWTIMTDPEGNEFCVAHREGQGADAVDSIV